MKNKTKDDEIIEEILEISFKVKTNKKERTIHYMDFENGDGTISIKKSDFKYDPKCQIIVTMNCEGYLLKIE